MLIETNALPLHQTTTMTSLRVSLFKFTRLRRFKKFRFTVQGYNKKMAYIATQGQFCRAGVISVNFDAAQRNSERNAYGNYV